MVTHRDQNHEPNPLVVILAFLLACLATVQAARSDEPDRANLDALLKRIAVECPAARQAAEAVTVGGTKDVGIGGTARFTVLAPPGDNLAQRLADAAEAAAGVWDGKCHLSYRDRPDENVVLWNCAGTDLGDNRLWIYGPRHRWLDLTREAVVRMVQP